MASGVIIAVRVTPRAGRNEIGAPDGDGVLRIRVTAPPVDGAANEAAARLVATNLAVPPSAVTIVSGASSRHKRLRISGADPAAVRARWPGVAVDELGARG